MVKRCCVPNCESNHNRTTRISCFQFPENYEAKRKWLNCIPGLEVQKITKDSGVCILHFEDKYIKATNDKGIPLERARLTKEAIPTIFDYRNDGVSDVFCGHSDLIKSLDHLKTELTGKIKAKSWAFLSTESLVTLYKLRSEKKGNLVVHFTVNIDSDLNVEVFHENGLIGSDFYTDIIRYRRHIVLFSELNQIIEKCNKIGDREHSDGSVVITKLLKNCLSNIDEVKGYLNDESDFEYAKCIDLISDQLKLMQCKKKGRRYSANTILSAYVIYTQSSKTYKLIRDSGMLILPSVRTLQRVSRYQNVDPNDSASNMNYLRMIERNLTNEEKFIAIQIDEIYSNPEVSYWNHLTGFAENSDNVATTVLGVMISSCFGKMREVANLIPLKDATGEDLRRYVLAAVDSLQTIGKDNIFQKRKTERAKSTIGNTYFLILWLGFIVLVVVTDNSRVNQNVFKLLSFDGYYYFKNPKHLQRVIRLIFDTIHIFKNFRNNWVNKKDEEKSFFYPKFSDPSVVQQASFKDLRDLHDSEKFKIIKIAPKLNTKTLYPSRFDRQRVPLVLNLIHPTTIAALKTRDCLDTAEFLEILQKWFKIVNNRSPVTAIERKEFSDHLITAECFQINFLKQFVVRLEYWKYFETQLLHEGGLTMDTFIAAHSSTNGIIKLIFESFTSTDVETFLCGKIQTNDLEIRFGRYRDLSGCQYNVSVRQILESEKKLRIKSMISLFPHELNSSKYSVKQSTTTDLTPFLDLLDSNYIEKFDDFDLGSFMYICGYGGHSLIAKLVCKFCRDLVVKSVGDYSDTDYFDYLQKGGLVIPTENSIFLLLHMSAIFCELRKDLVKRRLFQTSINQKSVLVLLTIEGVSRSDTFVVDLNDTCPCGTTYEDLFTPLLSIFANVILNNYRKKINDMALQRKLQESYAKKRKNETESDEQATSKQPKPNRKSIIYKKM